MRQASVVWLVVVHVLLLTVALPASVAGAGGVLSLIHPAPWFAPSVSAASDGPDAATVARTCPDARVCAWPPIIVM